MTTRIQKLSERLKDIAPIHFIGIGGSGMAPLAGLVRAAGVEISGSDTAKGLTLSGDLEGVPFVSNHLDLTLIKKAKTVVVSSAIRVDTPELEYAVSAGTKVMHRSELVALIATEFKLITVAGTHGKSTTSSLIAFALYQLGFDPSFIIGAKIKSLGPGIPDTAHRLGKGDYLVLEADESDGTFQKYHPFVAVVTNIDADHMDFYGSMEMIEKAFSNHLKNTSADGFSVLFWDDPRVQLVSGEPDLPGTRLTYGTFLGSEVRMLSYAQHGTTLSFKAVVERDQISVSLPLIGRHNAVNALACLAVMRCLGISLGNASKALSTFSGVSRRLALYYEDASTVVYDDYAHNPTKTSSLLGGLRAAFPESHICAVFQAHRYSRVRLLYGDMMASFQAANEVLVLPVYAAGEPEPTAGEDFSARTLAAEISKQSHVETKSCEGLKEALKLLQLNQPSKHTVYVTVGAGDVWTIAKDFASHLKSLGLP